MENRIVEAELVKKKKQNYEPKIKKQNSKEQASRSSERSGHLFVSCIIYFLCLYIRCAENFHMQNFPFIWLLQYTRKTYNEIILEY